MIWARSSILSLEAPSSWYTTFNVSYCCFHIKCFTYVTAVGSCNKKEFDGQPRLPFRSVKIYRPKPELNKASFSLHKNYSALQNYVV